MKIPLINLQAQQSTISEGLKKRLEAVLSHGQYIMGPEVKELENLLAKYTGSEFCITCGNGTDALMIALLALGIETGDEVITPAFSYISAAEAITLIGAKPVFVDVNPLTFNLDPRQLTSVLSNKTKAILPVSLFGQCADFELINDFASQNNLLVIEDAAQSFGATYKGKKSCNLSPIATTSFFPSKPLGCYGDGGAIFTNNSQLAMKAQQIRNHGQKKRYEHTILGMNSRLDTLQAAILLEKITSFIMRINLVV